MPRYETDVPSYTCPWCWEIVSTVVDCSALPVETIEDCEVCCRPAQLLIREGADGVLVEASRTD